MIKKILLGFGVIILLFAGLVFYLTNPDDPQYKSYYSELRALENYNNGDMDSFVKYMNNPITVQYHFPILLYIALTDMGRYEEAITAVNAYKKYNDYSYCMQYKTTMRFICRIINNFWGVSEPLIDKNFWLSKIYFEKGEIDKALEHNFKREHTDACYNAMLYSAAGNFKNASETLKECERKFFDKKNKRELYIAKGYFYLCQKKYNRAEDYFNKTILKVSPRYKKYKGNNKIYLLLAQVYSENNNPKKAREYYELVLKSDPYNYKAQKGLGLVLK